MTGGAVDPDESLSPADAEYPDVPDWNDEYVDRVSNRLMFNYDLEKDYRVRGESFTLYGEMRLESQKQFLHRSINYANHESREHLLVRRADSVSRADLEALVELGHDLADEWIVANEEHYGTDFTFAVVAPEIPEDVREFVSGFKDRNLLKLGYYGHYEVNLLVTAPDDEAVVESENADVAAAFRTWADVPEAREPAGFLARLVDRLRG
ncbi:MULTISPECIES: hypothetical protein [Halorussus]|uniref:hypothetical protein n=1 Tax=Halorussus TaxID=1070314 RepID=UPI00209E7DB8|nr:hypothetical protein [Halorussus vallis]USZ74085.1 hypothetical protein NGM07_11525 [Halorussus vallis]